MVLDHYEPYLAELTLKPSDGGRFEIVVNGDVVFSGLDAGRFPSEDEVIRLVGGEIGA